MKIRDNLNDPHRPGRRTNQGRQSLRRCYTRKMDQYKLEIAPLLSIPVIDRKKALRNGVMIFYVPIATPINPDKMKKLRIPRMRPKDVAAGLKYGYIKILRSINPDQVHPHP